MSGARKGEQLGAKWSDIDLQNSQIHIQRTFDETGKSRGCLQAGKCHFQLIW
jgi:integrase